MTNTTTQSEEVAVTHGFLSSSRRLAGLWFAACVAMAEILACGPNFPNMLLIQGDRAVLVAPRANFQREIERMQLANSPYKYNSAPGVGDASTEAELADLREALREAGKTDQESAELLARHAAQRRKLRTLAEGRTRRDGNQPADRDIEIVEGLPAEFADYVRGAIAWHRGDMGTTEDERTKWFEAAGVAWEALLQRSAPERKFKSTWAAFMLAVRERRLPGGNQEKAAAYFQNVRALVDAGGFSDSLGLAASSLGLEAQIYLGQGNLPRALELYLEQAATGDPSAIESLRMVAAQAFRPENRERLQELTVHPAAQRVITAYLVSRRSHWPENQDEENIIVTWLELLEAQNVRDVESAEPLALAAYQAGRMEIAQRWIGRSSAESAVTRWLQAKLLLYEGRLDDAAALLAKLCREFPVNAPHNPGRKASFPNCLTVASDGGLASIAAAEQALGELGVLRLARREFTEALDALLRSGFWLDAAYVAEQVLTVHELAAYVDAHWPAPANDFPIKSPEYWERITDPELLRVRVRYLLARRLARSQQEQKARQYYPTDWKAPLDELLSLLKTARDREMPPRKRARALFAAATMTRQHGLELFGTEVAPDWHVYSGNYTVGVTQDDRVAIRDPDRLVASREELARAALHRPEPDRRFHYRYKAAQFAFEAAQLLPDNDNDTARVLCTAGSWLKDRDPEAADVFYKALVRRCRKTAIGEEADRIRWFPRIDEEGNILPRIPPQPAAPEPQQFEPAFPITLL